ncbi:MAG: class I SAM-dependent methyltransferase [Candidatus Cloacimonadia bacterium]
MSDEIEKIKRLFNPEQSESALLRYNTIIFDPEMKETYTSFKKGIHSNCKPGSKRDFFISVFKEEFLTYIRGARRVLDIGCGVGWPTFLLAPYVRTIVGIDLSEEMIKLAKIANKKKYKMQNVFFKIANAERLPFSDAIFDAVIMDGSLVLTTDKNKVVKEIYRVLTPKGKVVCKELMWPKFVRKNVSYYNEGGRIIKYKNSFWVIYPVAELNPPKEAEFYFKVAEGSGLYERLLNLDRDEISRIRIKDLRAIKSAVEKSFYFEVEQFDPFLLRGLFERNGFKEIVVEGFSGDVVNYLWDKRLLEALVSHKEEIVKILIEIKQYLDCSKFENCILFAKKCNGHED